MKAPRSKLPALFDRFLRDRGGNYAVMTAVALVPIFGGMALAVDYAEMNRQKQAVLNALDAAGIATARHIVSGVSDADVIAYAHDFFEANLGPVDPATTQLSVELPSNQVGGGTLKLSALLRYEPMFLPVFRKMFNGTDGRQTDTIDFTTRTAIRLKNTLEVALVLDNSGSMNQLGSGSGQRRMDLLKAAAKQLVDTLAQEANLIRQVEKPVQFSLVPFAASVNVGPENSGAAWMDSEGRSPVHHENFDWTTLVSADRTAVNIAGIWYKSGTGWGTEEGEILSRFSLYKDMKKVETREWVVTGQEYVCTKYRSNGTCRSGYWKETGYYEETLGPFASWQGCVEARPWPYNVNDTPAAIDNPATLFVPMFAPDEPGDRWATASDETPDSFGSANNWWNDGTEDSSGVKRLRYMEKYFEIRPYGASSPQGSGPNYSCTTRPILPLTDVTTEEGLATVKAAIEAMAPNGGTNVPEGIAWGWRTVSHGEPFTQGRPDHEKGNDKVVIVLTDGENTYYTPGSLGYSDPAGSKSIYSSYGYLQPGYDGGSTGRLFLGTSDSVGKFNYSNSNYTAALNEHMAALCTNAKAAGVIVMTVALDLDAGNAAQAAQIAALRQCASDSRFRKDATDPSKPAKLFWNATGSSLAKDFEEIADELSNLRIVS
jgi:Flp pilus assembly protein TadG